MLSAPLFSPAGPGRLKAVLRTAVADQQVRQAELKPRLCATLLCELQDSLTDADLGSVDREALASAGIKDYYRQLDLVSRGRRPLATNLFLGIGPGEAAPGDLMHILAEAAVPYILRKDYEGRMRLVGAFVYRVIDGEAIEGNPALVPINNFQVEGLVFRSQC